MGHRKGGPRPQERTLGFPLARGHSKSPERQNGRIRGLAWAALSRGPARASHSRAGAASAWTFSAAPTQSPAPLQCSGAPGENNIPLAVRIMGSPPSTASLLGVGVLASAHRPLLIHSLIISINLGWWELPLRFQHLLSVSA